MLQLVLMLILMSLVQTMLSEPVNHVTQPKLLFFLFCIERCGTPCFPLTPGPGAFHYRAQTSAKRTIAIGANVKPCLDVAWLSIIVSVTILNPVISRFTIMLVIKRCEAGEGTFPSSRLKQYATQFLLGRYPFIITLK